MTVDPSEIERTGRIIYCAREVEAALRRLGATGTGLGELSSSVRKLLPESMMRDIHHLTAIRNQAAHEAGGAASPPDMISFEAMCGHLLRGLNDLGQAQRKHLERHSPKPPEQEELEAWTREFRSRMRIAACIPMLNWPFFTVLIFSGLWHSLKYWCALILQLLALPLFYGGQRYEEPIYWAAGAGLALGAWVWGILLLTAQKPRPAWWNCLPVVNGFRLAFEALRRMSWSRWLVGLIGLALDIWAVVEVFRFSWRNFAVGMGIAYVIGLAAVVIWGRIPKPEDAPEK